MKDAIRKAQLGREVSPETAERLAALWASDKPPTTMLGKPTKPLADTQLGTPAPDGMINPYWDVVRQLPVDELSRYRPEVNAWDGRHFGLPVDRQDLAYTYAFAIPSPADIAFLVEQLDGRPVIELGAGTGYWAWQLSQSFVDVLAFDNNLWSKGGRLIGTQYHPVHEGSIEQLELHANRVLMLCWPDYDTTFAADALTDYTGDLLVYIGEGPGGCCGDDHFGDLLTDQWEHVGSSSGHINFTGIHSDVGVYRRAS